MLLQPGLASLALAALARNAAVPTSLAAVATSLPSHHHFHLNRLPPRADEVEIDRPTSSDDKDIEAAPASTTTPAPATDNDQIISVTMTPSPTLSQLPAAAATATGSPHADKPTECRLLGSFAILVQLALGALALLALVYKRWRERPQRPVKIWFFDVSKQVFGSVLVHMANVFMSLLTSGRFSIKVDPATVATVISRGLGLGGREDVYVPNPCSFYLLNLAIDTTLGIPVLIIIVRMTTKLVAYTPLGQPPESIQSGNYGTPPNAWWWLKQSVIYFCGLMGMKFCVLVLFMMFPWISHVGDWALGWTEGNEELQIVFVMMLFPLIMNAMQYYIIDSYIKKQDTSADGSDLSEDSSVPGETVVYEELSISENEASDDEDAESHKQLRGGHVRLARRDTAPPKDGEYDPDVDGDSQTVIGSSSSRASNGRGDLPKELIPPE